VADGSLSLRKRLLFGAIVMIGLPIGALIAIEGASSLVLLTRDLAHPTKGMVTERAHTNYDTLLGWVARPRFYHRDFYGPGISLRTNAQGFRNDHEITRSPQAGRIRLICSGDSFTLGWGVAGDRTWCALLQGKNPRLETVNLGQGGYGADQAYLWYKRDGQPLNHDLHVFALIHHDLERMQVHEFLGYGKPVLALVADTIRVSNVPVPPWPYRVPRVASYFFWKRPVFGELRMAELLERLRHRFASDRQSAGESPDGATWQVADRMLRDLVRTNRSKHSQLVVVFLPERNDWRQGASDRWRGWAAAAAPRDSFLFVDLVEDVRRLPRDSLDLLFLHTDPYKHYGDAGHRWVAGRLYQHLLAAPAIAATLGPTTRSPVTPVPLGAPESPAR
jgi:hypothetical protein